MEFNLASYLFLGSVPIILGLVQVVKAWIADARFYPVLAIVFGLAINLLIAAAIKSSLVSAVIMGIIAGLTAGGVYSAATSGKPK